MSDPITRCVSDTAEPILLLGRNWMLSPSVMAHGAELGFSSENPMDFWINGRAGVLGNCDATQAATALGFVGPDLVAKFWNDRPSAVDGLQAATEYAKAAAAWGAQYLGDAETSDCEELVPLAMKTAAGGDLSLGQLFAGWRELPLPTDPRGAAVQALNVLRELRGGAHLHAVFAAGLTPLQSILSVDHPTHGGPGRASRFGWSEPFPEPDHDARAKAEELTSEIVANAYRSSLTDVEAARLTELTIQVTDALGQ